MSTKVRGIKGATTTKGTSARDVLDATEELLSKLVQVNNIKQDDLIESIAISGKITADKEMQETLNEWNKVIDTIML